MGFRAFEQALRCFRALQTHRELLFSVPFLCPPQPCPLSPVLLPQAVLNSLGKSNSFGACTPQHLPGGKWATLVRINPTDGRPLKFPHADHQQRAAIETVTSSATERKNNLCRGGTHSAVSVWPHSAAQHNPIFEWNLCYYFWADNYQLQLPRSDRHLNAHWGGGGGVKQSS